jgi:DNA ligase-associated metallophosphoesterase
MSSTVVIERNGYRLHLLAQRAVFCETSQTLCVADVHLGKARTFRSLGVPVPSGTTQANLQAISQLLISTQALRLVVLGDLLHGPAAQHPSVISPLAQWRVTHASVQCVLVRGNHDDRAGDPPASCGFEIVDEPYLIDSQARLLGCHHPQSHPDSLVLCGHEHPVYRLHDSVGGVRLPCFYQTDDRLVLPAFGAFTGGWVVNQSPAQAVYVTDGDRVYCVPGVRRAA